MDNLSRLDSVFSQYIRLRDSKEYDFKMFRCISCGCILPFEEMDCGHFIKRSNMATRFDEENCHGQCISCNRFRNGNTEKYRANLESLIGAERVEELIRKGRSIAKYSSNDLGEMVKLYQRKIKELKK